MSIKLKKSRKPKRLKQNSDKHFQDIVDFIFTMNITLIKISEKVCQAQEIISNTLCLINDTLKEQKKHNDEIAKLTELSFLYSDQVKHQAMKLLEIDAIHQRLAECESRLHKARL